MTRGKESTRRCWKDLQATGLTPQNWADLAWAKQAFRGAGRAGKPAENPEQIYKQNLRGK